MAKVAVEREREIERERKRGEGGREIHEKCNKDSIWKEASSAQEAIGTLGPHMDN